MTKLLSLLSIGMFTVSHHEKVDGEYRRAFKVKVDPKASALQRLLQEGQCLIDDTFHNASWYNKFGEKLGWGDLSKRLIPEIQKVLPAGEIFLILHEAAGFWNLHGTNIDQTRPGIKFVAEKAAAVITPNGVYVPMNEFDAQRRSHMEKLNLRGVVPAHYVTREWLHKLLDTANRTECNLEGDTKFVVAPVEHPPLVEELLPHPWTVGDGWTCSQPEQKQDDGRWKLYVYDALAPRAEAVVEFTP